MDNRSEPMTIALAGNPNVGKSTLFNALTGLRQHTGNWAGKTVGMARGTVRHGREILELVDLPGTYSLEGKSEDELVAAEFIREGRADCVVAVCDGSCLERTLILALEILTCCPRMVLCVNLMDEAERRGIRVDPEKMEALLGIPVVLTAAGSGRGLETLLGRITAAQWSEPKPSGGDFIEQAEKIASQCVTSGEDPSKRWRTRVDGILVSRRFGIPIIFLLLLLIVWLTVWGANYPSSWLEALFDRGYLVLKRWTSGLPWWLSGALVDGMYATAACVMSVMLPPMAIFFPLFTILEDIGYLPRMAFLLDRPLCRCGGCGKQALTLCMGLGCNAVGVTGCRIIDSPRERLLAILTNAMVPCNGRFPTLILLGSLFFPDAGAAFIVAACVVLGMLGAMGASGILSRTALRHERSVFLMEMPPLRRPRILKILIRSLLDRTLHIAGRALTVAAPAGIVLWILANTSLLGYLAEVLDPVGSVLGMNGIILLGFCLSMPANELLIPVILMVLTRAGSLQNVTVQAGDALLGAGWTWQMAVSTMVFTLFHWPCSTTLLTIHRETGSMKKTAAAFLLPTAVGILLCVLLNLIFQDLGR